MGYRGKRKDPKKTVTRKKVCLKTMSYNFRPKKVRNLGKWGKWAKKKQGSRSKDSPIFYPPMILRHSLNRARCLEGKKKKGKGQGVRVLS